LNFSTVFYVEQFKITIMIDLVFEFFAFASLVAFAVVAVLEMTKK
jgi:hypothetical protein